MHRARPGRALRNNVLKMLHLILFHPGVQHTWGGGSMLRLIEIRASSAKECDALLSKSCSLGCWLHMLGPSLLSSGGWFVCQIIRTE